MRRERVYACRGANKRPARVYCGERLIQPAGVAWVTGKDREQSGWRWGGSYSREIVSL